MYGVEVPTNNGTYYPQRLSGLLATSVPTVNTATVHCVLTVKYLDSHYPGPSQYQLFTSINRSISTSPILEIAPKSFIAGPKRANAQKAKAHLHPPQPSYIS